MAISTSWCLGMGEKETAEGVPAHRTNGEGLGTEQLYSDQEHQRGGWPGCDFPFPTELDD